MKADSVSSRSFSCHQLEWEYRDYLMLVTKNHLPDTNLLHSILLVQTRAIKVRMCAKSGKRD